VAGERVFVSHAGRDRAWAEWVAWQLQQANYEVELDTWDWSAGESFVERMRDALQKAAKVVALFSTAYFEPERFTNPEWTAVFAVRDGTGPRLIPVKVEEVTAPTLLRPYISRSLYGLDVATARQVLLDAVGGARRPDTEPEFPGGPVAKPVAQTGPRLPGVLPAVWNVPPRTPVFTGRDQMLLDLRDRLSAGGPVLVQALQGWGGVGKTTLAIEYAHRFASSYDLVWWVDAERAELIGEQLAALGAAAGWMAEDAPTPKAVAMVRRHLQTSRDWLVVFDNATTDAEIRDWLPQGPGHVIVTSRHPSWEHVAASMSVDVFVRDESVALLHRLAPRLNPELADQISAMLGDLPLALAQAGGVLAATGINGETYLAELRTHIAQAMAQGQPAGYPQSLAAAIQISLERVATEDPAAVRLLEVCAMLAPEPVPLELFTGAPDGLLPEPLASVAGSLSAVAQRVTRLGRYGLVKPGEGGPVLHRLTQAVLVDLLDPGVRVGVRGLAERLVVAGQPVDAVNPVWWPVWARLLPHLLALDPDSTGNQRLRQMAHWAAFFLLARGDLAAGHALAGRLYRAWRDRWGGDDYATLAAAHTLAYAHRLRGDHRRAHELDQDTLARCRRVLGQDHHDTLTSASNLANDLRALGRVDEALVLDEDTLARKRRVLGEDHPDTLNSANNLALDLRALGRVQEALVLDEDTLARSRRVLGQDHPSTLASANNLAGGLHALGRVDEALVLDEDTLARKRRVLGQDHRDTLTSANNLADDLRGLGRVDEALALDEDTLARRRRVLGEAHPDTLLSAGNLARDLRAVGRTQEAEALEEFVREHERSEG
jgi:hypothetical protein